MRALHTHRFFFQRWKEPHGGMSNGPLIDLAKMLQGFVSHNLVGVDEAKLDCGHIPGFSDAGKLLTLPNIDGNFTQCHAFHTHGTHTQDDP